MMMPQPWSLAPPIMMPVNPPMMMPVSLPMMIPLVSLHGSGLGSENPPMMMPAFAKVAPNAMTANIVPALRVFLMFFMFSPFSLFLGVTEAVSSMMVLLLQAACQSLSANFNSL